MQPIYLITLNTLLVQGAHVGSRVVASLLVLKLGANPFTVGLLIGVYAVFPLFGFYVPIYGHSIGLSASTIGNILGAFAIATFIVRVLLPWFTRRFGIEPVLAAAAFAAAVLFLPFPLVENVPVLFARAFGIGFALGCSQPLTLNLAYNYSPPGRTGEVTGLRLTINNVTHIGVPVAAGGLATALGVGPVFWTSAALLAVGGWLTRKRAD